MKEMFLLRMTEARAFTSEEYTAIKLLAYHLRLAEFSLVQRDMLLTLLDDRYEVACVLIGLGRFDGEQFILTSLSSIVVITEDLSEGLTNVLEF